MVWAHRWDFIPLAYLLFIVMIVLLCTRPSVRTLEIISLALYLRSRALIHYFLHLLCTSSMADNSCPEVSRIHCWFKNWDINHTSCCTNTYLNSTPHYVKIIIVSQCDHAVFIRMLMDFALVSWSYPVVAWVASTQAVNGSAPNLLRLTPRPLFLIPVQAKAGSSESHLEARGSVWCIASNLDEESTPIEKDCSSLHLVCEGAEVI
jgi:hypothetical protein